MMSIWLVTQFIACLYMTGVIWIIQLVHYPSFSRINAGEFRQFHSLHSKFLGLLVGPVMAVELLSALALATSLSPFWLLNLALVMLLWVCTFFLSVPLHHRLAEGRDPRAIARLVVTNWPRTAIWTLRAIMLACYFFAFAKFG